MDNMDTEKKSKRQKPVSYTHLDVYKRQVLRHAGGAVAVRRRHRQCFAEQFKERIDAGRGINRDIALAERRGKFANRDREHVKGRCV